VSLILKIAAGIILASVVMFLLAAVANALMGR
jgi:hypothetical protein